MAHGAEEDGLDAKAKTRAWEDLGQAEAGRCNDNAGHVGGRRGEVHGHDRGHALSPVLGVGRAQDRPNAPDEGAGT